jgi:hypothetical protein
MKKKFTFSGSVYFDRMNELGLYSTDQNEIGQRVADSGMSGFFEKKVA